MSTVAERAPMWEIEQLFGRYCRSLDTGDPAEFKSTFWPDAVLVSPLLGGNFEGGSGLDEFLRKVDEGRRERDIRACQHHVSNIIVDSVDENECEVWSQFVYFTCPHGVAGMSSFGQYHDRVTCRDGLWKLAYRSIEITSFEVPALPGS